MTLSATVTLHVLPVPGPSFPHQTACPHRRARQHGPPPPHPGAPEVGRWARAPPLQTPDWGGCGEGGRHSQEVGPGQLSSPCPGPGLSQILVKWLHSPWPPPGARGEGPSVDTWYVRPSNVCVLLISCFQ